MALYAALAEGRIPVTEKAVEIAESCDLCGKCDYQCYFVTEMRPTRVMPALKDLVARHLAAGGAGRAARPKTACSGKSGRSSARSGPRTIGRSPPLTPAIPVP